MFFWEMLATIGLHDCPLTLFGKVIIYYLLFENRGLEVLFLSLLNHGDNKAQLLACTDPSQQSAFIKKQMIRVLECESIGQIVEFGLFEQLLHDSFLL